MEQALVDHVTRARSQWERLKNEDNAGGFAANFLTSTDLATLDVRQRWLIKNVLVADMPALLGGPKKSLKTSLMLDMVISLGSGKSFLGKFEVPQKVKVAVLSGESGQATIKETALRIARTKGVDLATCDVLWGFELPRLGVDEDLAALSAALQDNKVKVVFIDPAYLCLLAGSRDVQANNMFQVGPLLVRVAKICQQTGTTLVLVHHTTKAASMQRTQEGEPLELEDLAYAGFQEFARQWLLLNRRQKYEPGSGKHLLWLNLGGSDGHSGCWGIDVDEGVLDDNFNGRRWLVQVRSLDEAKKVVEQQKERVKDDRKKAKLEGLKIKLRQALLDFPAGETISFLAARIGESRTTGVTEALSEMRLDGQVEVCTVTKPAGRRMQDHPGWRLTGWGAGLNRQTSADSKQRNETVNAGAAGDDAAPAMVAEDGLAA